jgi:exopolysaccharide biosynthesis polyprenyl glycosylphosphotransferase
VNVAPVESSAERLTIAEDVGSGAPGAPRSSLDSALRRLLVAADLAALVLGLALVIAPGARGDGSSYWAALTLPAWIVVLKAYGLYDGDRKRMSHTTVADVPRLFHALLLGSVLFWCYCRLVPVEGVDFAHVLGLSLLTGTGALALRSVARHAVRRIACPEHVLVVGEGDGVALLVRKMRAHPEYAAEPVALARSGWGTRYGLPVVATADEVDLRSVVRSHGIDRVMLANEGISSGTLLRLLRDADHLSIKASVVPQPSDALGASVEIDDIEGVTVLAVHPPTLSRTARIAKRTLDIVGSLILIVVLAPLMAAVAVAVKLDSAGPALFRQERIGRRGRRFRVVKFRTMVAGTQSVGDTLRRASRDPHWLLLDKDPRITRVGAFLRRASLDELPQLWNVVRGQMSLVGPRPLTPADDAQVTGWGHRRLDVTPGLTGLWQVLGRTAIPFEEMVKLDYLYVANWSLWRDIELLLRTLPILLSGRGAN